MSHKKKTTKNRREDVPDTAVQCLQSDLTELLSQEPLLKQLAS